MRVLLVANTLPPDDLSGVGEQVVQLASGLRERGVEVEVLGRGRGGARGPKLLFPITASIAAWRRLRRLRPHVVQVHESDGAAVALLVRCLAPLLDPVPRLVALLQVSYVEEMRSVRALRAGGRVLGRPGAREWRFRWLKAPLQIALGCLTAWLAEIVLAPSQATAREIERDYGIERVEILPNVTAGVGAPSGAPPGGRSAVGDYFLFVGRLRIRKGIEVLLDALSRLPEQASSARLMIAGDGEHRHRLEAAVERLGIAGRVEFLGRCDRNRLWELLAGTRALVVPSVYEGMPLVVLEAMDAGVPVVASRVSGIPEVVVDGTTGWLVPPEQPAALARALAEVWSDGVESARRGAAGRQRVVDCYHPRGAAQRWLELVRAPAGTTEEREHADA